MVAMRASLPMPSLGALTKCAMGEMRGWTDGDCVVEDGSYRHPGEPPVLDDDDGRRVDDMVRGLCQCYCQCQCCTISLLYPPVGVGR